MKVHGVIDNFFVESEKVVFSGWAHAADGLDRFHVDDVEIAGIATVVEFFERKDFEPGNLYGFRITCSTPSVLAAMAWGWASCTAVKGDVSAAVPVWDKLQNRMLLSAMKDRIVEKLHTKEFRQLFAELSGAVRNAALPRDAAEDVQEVIVSTGLASYDGVVMLGKDGHAFLVGGSNAVGELYGMPAKGSHVVSWSQLVRERDSFCEAQGARFLQVVVPEKQSVLADLYPDPIDAPTPLLRAVAAELDGFPSFLELSEIFTKSYRGHGLVPFRRMDSHLSYHGAQLSASEICMALTGDPLMIESPPMTERLISGDLGEKFAMGNLLERANVPVVEDWSFGRAKPLLQAKFDPDNGHTGAWRQWLNEVPLIDKSILIFGNSVFERGGSPFGLSWWFSRIFRSTTFVWSSAMDRERIVRESPDYVVCQTVERFLTNLPPR